MSKLDSAVQLVRELGERATKEFDERWEPDCLKARLARLRADNFGLVLEALEYTQNWGHHRHASAEDRSVPRKQCPLHPCVRIRDTLAAVAEGAKKALKR